jgi:hypothetical protein
MGLTTFDTTYDTTFNQRPGRLRNANTGPSFAKYDPTATSEP